MPDDAPAIPTPVVDYPHLRLLAEWSSSLRDQAVGFAFAEGALWRVGHGAPAGAPALRLPASTPGRYGAVRSLLVSVEGVDEPLDLSPWGADALVWSEAAVEKFLVPYYASCAGARSARFLGALLDAWNGEHGEVHPVALAHLGHALGRDAPLTLADTLGVVFLREAADGAAGTLEMLPLGAFRARHPARWEPPAETEPGVVALGRRELPADAVLPAYPALRGMAEWAGSLRGRTAYLAYDPSPPSPGTHRRGRVSRVPDPGSEPPSRIVVPVRTPLAVPGRPKPGSVLLVTEDGAEVDLFRDPHCDAAFTSTGAMEQLLFPYYASVRGGLAPDELRQMAAAWGAVDPAGGTARAEGDEDAPPALVHLPRSDWEAEGGEPVDAGSPLDDVGVVVRDGGRRRVVTVREALARRG